MKREEKRARLIEVAADIFNREGYHAAGVDKVIAEAGIAKTTLYRHFPSKDDLIVAALQLTDERFRSGMRRAVEQTSADAYDRLLATFDFLERWISRQAFNGCPFIGATTEFASDGGPIVAEAARHKRLTRDYFAELARAADMSDPEDAADIMNLLHEGATAIAHVTADAAPARKAKELAARLLPRPGRRGGA